MKRSVAIFLGGILLAAAAPAATAGPTLTIVADAANPSNPAAGQSLTFDVNLSGLGAGDQLGYLAATVIFPASLLGTPSSVNPGSIIPDPLNFTGTPLSGEADALYDAVFLAHSNTPISANGTFFTFDVTAQAPGFGLLTFDPSSLAANDTSGSPITVDSGRALGVNITGTPEPASLVLFLTGMCTVGAARAYPRKR